MCESWFSCLRASTLNSHTFYWEPTKCTAFCGIQWRTWCGASSGRCILPPHRHTRGEEGQAKRQDQAAVEKCPVSGVDRCEEDQGEGLEVLASTLWEHCSPTGHSRARDRPLKKLLMKNHNLAKKSIPSSFPRVTEIFSNPQTPHQPLHPEGPSSPLCRPISVSLRALTANPWAFLVPSYRITKGRLCYSSGLQTGRLKTVETDRLLVLKKPEIQWSRPHSVWNLQRGSFPGLLQLLLVCRPSAVFPACGCITPVSSPSCSILSKSLCIPTAHPVFLEVLQSYGHPSPLRPRLN